MDHPEGEREGHPEEGRPDGEREGLPEEGRPEGEREGRPDEGGPDGEREGGPDGRRRGQVVIQMIPMNNEPGFVPAAVHLGERDARWHRINPVAPAGVRDGRQGPNLVVVRQRNSPSDSSENDSSEERRMEARERRRDEERRSPCPTFPRILFIIVACMVLLVIVVIILALHLLDPPYSVNGTLPRCYDGISINPGTHCLNEIA